MPDYHYLGKQGFPHAQGVDVYRYENGVDYSRYDSAQMRVTLCSVPWDLGEAHIGNRTIDGVGNVVFFGSKQKRDAWFGAIPDDECFRWDSRYKELHTSLEIAVPVPFDVAVKYNYIFVQYHLFANDSSPVEYEDAGGVLEWCYFVRDVAFTAPNTSTLTLMADTWQTFIYDFDVTGMILERGHAPLFKTSVSDYLKSPIDNCRYLLAPDVSFGELQRAASVNAVSLNAFDVMACVVTSGDCDGNWGTKEAGSWNTPAPRTYNLSGVPNLQCIAMAASDLNAFLRTVRDTMPQFLQTVQAVFFAERGFLTLGAGFQFGGVACALVMAGKSQAKDIVTLSKSLFGYPEKYAGIAKLYTYPYAAIEVSDEKGNVAVLHVEDTTGTISADVAANIVFPFLDLQATLRGVGGKASRKVSFQNVGAGSFDFSGRWYSCLLEWHIPTFAVLDQASVEYDYASHFDRAQMDNDRSTAYTIATRDAANANTNATTQASATQAIANSSAATDKANSERDAEAQRDCAVAQANTEYANTSNDAQNVLDNSNAQVAANTAVTATSTDAASLDASYVMALGYSLAEVSNKYTNAAVNAEMEAKAQSAALSAASSVVNSASGGAISGAMTAGAVGAASGAVAGLVSGSIDAASTVASTSIAINLSSTQATLNNAYNLSNAQITNNFTSERTTAANDARTDISTATNTMNATVAANTAATMTTNATNTQATAGNVADKVRDTAVADAEASYATATGNASTAYNTSVTVACNDLATANADAQSTYDNEGERIQNLIRQAGLGAPSVYGRIDNAATASTRPQAIIANVVTQSDYAIASAGDEMLRYGYNLGQAWDFDGNWCVGRHFTYWKLRDYWVRANAMLDVYQDALRFFLMGGVTVWGRPEDIGKVSIYDNGI